MWQALLPFLILAFLLVAPRRNGGAADPGARTRALLVLGWGMVALVIAYLWSAGWWLVLLEWMGGPPP